MRAWEFQPGVPAAGHVTASGFWHPGRIEGCVKCDVQRAFGRMDTCGDCGKSISREHDAEGNCP